MYRSLLMSAAAIALSQTSALAAQEAHYSGQSYCGSNFRHTYVISSGDDGFQVIREKDFSRYDVTSYPEALGSMRHSYGRASFEVQSADDGSLALYWMDGRCQGSSVLAPMPSDPVSAYQEVVSFASSSETSPKNAVKLSDMVYNLPPSGLLPDLDQATLPKSTYDAVNEFYGEYLTQQDAIIDEMPVTSEDEAKALLSKVAEVYDPKLGFDLNIFEERSLKDRYQRKMEDAAFRVASAGYEVAPMSGLEEERFCALVDTTIFNRADRMEPLFGLPFAYWDREFTEGAMARLEECGNKWGAEKAKRLAKHYPRIVQASENLSERLAAAEKDRELLAEIESNVSEIDKLPNEIGAYLDTNGYRDFQNIEVPRGSSREVREASSQLHKLVRERQKAALPVIGAYAQKELEFSEDQFMSDDWEFSAAYDDPRCEVPGLPADLDFDAKNIIRGVCSNAIIKANGERNERLCELTQEKTGLSSEELDTLLIVNAAEGAEDVDNVKLGKLICELRGRTEFSWSENSGFFSSGYTLEATDKHDQSLTTTVTFEEEEELGGMVPQEYIHSTGGNLEDRSVRDQLTCMASPGYQGCAAS